MKTNLLLLSALFASASILGATPLAGTAAVHTQPDEASPTISVLKAGTDPVPAPDSLATTPAGWMAVDLPGPFVAYVQNTEIMKNLDVKEGAPVYLEPRLESGVLTTMAKDDKSEITGLHGRWTQIKVQKHITGYIRVGGAPGYLPPIATSPATTAPAPSPSPVAPVAYGVMSAGRPAPVVNLGDNSSGTLPRFFQGKFASTRSLFHPRRPYDWALNDNAGVRYAYLDVSKLLLTEQIDKYVGHEVVAYGTVKPVPGGKDIVIAVESLQLK